MNLTWADGQPGGGPWPDTDRYLAGFRAGKGCRVSRRAASRVSTSSSSSSDPPKQNPRPSVDCRD
jgi:hypothetical protein